MIFYEVLVRKFDNALLSSAAKKIKIEKITKLRTERN